MKANESGRRTLIPFGTNQQQVLDLASPRQAPNAEAMVMYLTPRQYPLTLDVPYLRPAPPCFDHDILTTCKQKQNKVFSERLKYGTREYVLPEVHLWGSKYIHVLDSRTRGHSFLLTAALRALNLRRGPIWGAQLPIPITHSAVSNVQS